MTLPQRRPPQRSGIERRPRREFPRHKKFVRSHLCCITGLRDHVCEGPIVFAHVRTGTDGGKSLKPSDWWGVSLCDSAHRFQHQIGEPAFEKRFGIDMKALAREFASKSPDVSMRIAMKEADA